MRKTITEALAEIPLIEKKIQSKREYISQNVGRTSVMADPLAKTEGGSPAVIAREFQAIGDLSTQLVKIRSAIQERNTTNYVTLGEKTMTVAEWLNWRREVAPKTVSFLKQVTQACQQMKNQFERSPQILKDQEGKQTIIQPVFHVDLEWVQKELERNEAILGELDGKLSMMNATTFVEV